MKKANVVIYDHKSNHVEPVAIEFNTTDDLIENIKKKMEDLHMKGDVEIDKDGLAYDEIQQLLDEDFIVY